MLTEWIGRLSALVWGWPMMAALAGTHLWMTIRTGFIQRELGTALRLSVSREPGAGEVSPFGALATALSSTIGTGNILGVAAAIGLGGPGAVLWMWLMGIFGMATKYAETLLAVKYRVRGRDGAIQGGAMYVLARGLGWRRMGAAFAALGAACAFGIGCTVQANTAAECIVSCWPHPLAAALGLSLLTVAAVAGGLGRISRTAETLVPVMAGAYLLGCGVLLVQNRALIGRAAAVILTGAVRPQALGGGLGGHTVAQACRYGMARGLFSNEAGMGSSPLAAAAARSRNPKRQALVSMTGTFWDTVVICGITGLTMVSAILRDPALAGLDGGALAGAVFAQIPHVGRPFLAAALGAFAFSTILGWYYYGERCAVYLLGAGVIPWYKGLWVLGVFAGALMEMETVWAAAEALNGLMAIPNLAAVWALGDVVARETRRYGGPHLADTAPGP